MRSDMGSFRRCPIATSLPIGAGLPRHRAHSALLPQCIHPSRSRFSPVYGPIVAAPFRYRVRAVPNLPGISSFRRCSIPIPKHVCPESVQHRILPSRPTCRYQCLSVTTLSGMASLCRCSAPASVLLGAGRPRYRTFSFLHSSCRHPFRSRPNPVSIPIVVVPFLYLARAAPKLPGIDPLRRCFILAPKLFVSEPAPR